MQTSFGKVFTEIYKVFSSAAQRCKSPPAQPKITLGACWMQDHKKGSCREKQGGEVRAWGRDVGLGSGARRFRSWECELTVLH